MLNTKMATAARAALLQGKAVRSTISIQRRLSPFATTINWQEHTPHRSSTIANSVARARLQSPLAFTSLRPFQQEQVRFMTHAKLYLARAPNAPPPFKAIAGLSLPIDTLTDEAYASLTRYDGMDSWFWLRPGNVVQRVEVGNARAGSSKETVDLAAKGSPYAAQFENIPREKRDQVTFVPIDKPNSETPLAVHSFSFSDKAKTPSTTGAVRQPQSAPKMVQKKQEKDDGVGQAFWTPEMLGSMNDPKTRKARKEAFRASFDRSKKVGKPSSPSSSAPKVVNALDYLNGADQPWNRPSSDKKK
ncbi:hypothetical protein CF327_g1210 [Tilletia walkeri]|nr:hypothetical protein CF327_g1210 [Tilletia walkeri]